MTALLDMDARRENNVDGRDKPGHDGHLYDTTSLAQFAPAVCRRSRYASIATTRPAMAPVVTALSTVMAGLVPAIHVLVTDPRSQVQHFPFGIAMRPPFDVGEAYGCASTLAAHPPDSPTRKQPG